MQEFIKIWKEQLQSEYLIENMNFYEAVEGYRAFKVVVGLGLCQPTLGKSEICCHIPLTQLALEKQSLPDSTIRKTLFVSQRWGCPRTVMSPPLCE